MEHAEHSSGSLWTLERDSALQQYPQPTPNKMKSFMTRHPSNLRHLVTRVHFPSRDKDGGYTNRSAVPENPTLHANITAVCLIE